VPWGVEFDVAFAPEFKAFDEADRRFSAHLERLKAVKKGR